MKTLFKKYFDDIEVRDELIDLSLAKYNQKKHHLKYKLIVSFICVVLVFGGIIHYRSSVDYMGDFTIYSLDNDEKKDITTTYTKSQARICVVDTSQLSEKEIEEKRKELEKNTHVECYSSSSLISYGSNTVDIFYYQLLYFNMSIKNAEHLKNVTIKSQTINGYLSVIIDADCYNGSAVMFSGEELRHSEAYNRPFLIHWHPSDIILSRIHRNPQYDLSSIKDNINISITYDNGQTVEKNLAISFDQEGYMSVKFKK